MINDNKPIYLQIADGLMDDVLAERYVADGRIPSVRDVGVTFQVNANTALRAFEQLERDGIIYNKRGLGYFVSPDAAAHIAERRRREFYSGEMEYFFGRLRQIGITPAALANDYTKYLNSQA